MIKIMKKLVVTSLLTMSIIGMTSVGASAEWKQDSQQNYSWTENGVKAQGWKFISNNWYHFRNDGAMEVSWVQDNGNWYYLWSNGSMASNTWLNRAGGWYYFDSTGKMVYDSTIIGAREYNFKAPAFIFSNDLANKTNAVFATLDSQTTTGPAAEVK